MKFRPLLLCAIAALFAFALPRPTQAADVSFDFFYDSLSPHGEWLEVGDYGYCWRPTGVDEDWAPYADGYWAYTDGGWTWVSYEEFGGIVYHYGRWVKLEDEGWCWVPDYEWAPAWVSWRHSEENIGWAPLPPEVEYRRERGVSVWVDSQYDIGPSSYNFCHTRDFGAPVLRGVLLPRRNNVLIIGSTLNVTNITYNDASDCIFNGGPDYVEINRYAERPIPALRLVQNNNITIVNNNIVNNNVRIKNVNAVQQGNQLSVFNPRVVRPQREQLATRIRPRLARTIATPRINNGWANLPQAERAALRAKLKQEVGDRSPETTPARGFRVADVQAVPEKADPKAKLPTTDPRGRAGRERAGQNTNDPAVATNPEPAAGAPATAGNPAAQPGAAIRDGRGRRAGAGEPDGATTNVPVNPATNANSAGAFTGEPRNAREAARLAREKTPQGKGAQKRAASADADGEAPIANTPGTAADDPRAGRGGKSARPDVLKPFKNTDADSPPAAVSETPATTQPNSDTNARQQAAEARKQAAAEAAEKRASDSQAARERAAAQAQQQQTARQAAREAAAARRQLPQESAPADRNNATAPDQNVGGAARERAQQAAQERQRLQQQQQSGARERAQEAAAQKQAGQRQVQQDQSAARQRAQEAALQRQGAAEERAQAAAEQRQRLQQQSQQNESRQRAVEQQQGGAARAQQAAAQQQRAAQQYQHQQQQARQQAAARAQAPPAPHQAPAPRQGGGNGKRKLTPEEAAALQAR